MRRGELLGNGYISMGKNCRIMRRGGCCREKGGVIENDWVGDGWREGCKRREEIGYRICI